MVSLSNHEGRGRPKGSRDQVVIVVQAFEADADGEMVPATKPRRMPDERQAIALARDLAQRHAGVAASPRTSTNRQPASIDTTAGCARSTSTWRR